LVNLAGGALLQKKIVYRDTIILFSLVWKSVTLTAIEMHSSFGRSKVPIESRNNIGSLWF
jgi:hypothetical protein